VRAYRDWSIADFIFTLLFTVVGAYGAFHMSVRAEMCEVLSSQPELLRDVVEMGLSLENCELWFERAAMGFVAISVVVLVARVSCFRDTRPGQTLLIMILAASFPSGGLELLYLSIPAGVSRTWSPSACLSPAPAPDPSAG
jgi:hypothetical protein